MGPAPGPPPPCGPAERFVRVEVHHVGAKVAGPGDSQNGVHVRAVQVDQRARVVGPAGDLADLTIEHAQRIRVGDHEHGGRFVEVRGQVVHVDVAGRRALDGYRVEAGHAGAGRVRAVCAVWREHFRTPLAGIAKVGRGHQQRRQLALRAGGGLQRDGRQPGNFGQHLLQVEQQFEQALQCRFRLIGVQVKQPRQRRQPFVALGVVLHGTGAERIEVRVDRHVERRQIREVPHQLGLG